MATTGEQGQLGVILDGGTTLGLGPAELLGRFRATHDEAAFAAIVAQHGPMVLATCRRILSHGADADDAFQATFLVFARHAGSIHQADRLGPWLHRVARRASVRVRSLANRRRIERAGNIAAVAAREEDRELRSVLDEELSRLPAKYRDPLVLCYLEGLTHDEAAGQLNWPVGTVRSRLAGGRDRLRSRLARRGFAPSALAVLSPATLPSAAVSRLLQAATVRLAYAGMARSAATSAAAVLAQGVLTSMFVTKLQTAAIATLAVAATLAAGTAGVLARQQPAADSRPAPIAAPPSSQPTSDPIPEAVAQLTVLKEQQKVLNRRVEQITFEHLTTLEQLTQRRLAIQQEILQSEARLKELVARDSADPAAAPSPDAANARIKALEERVLRQATRIAGLEETLKTQSAKTPAATAPNHATEPVPDLASPPQTIHERMDKLPQEIDGLQQASADRKIDIPPELRATGSPMRPFRINDRATPRPATGPTPPTEAKPAGQAKLPPTEADPSVAVVTLPGSPAVLMVVPASKDRVTMINPETQRQATLRLRRPVQVIRAVTNVDPGRSISPSGPTAVAPHERQLIDGLVGLSLLGTRIEQVAIFDRNAMQWFEHDLPQPASRIIPSMDSSSTLVGFGASFPAAIPTMLAFDARDRTWPVVTLPEPVAGVIAADVSPRHTVAFEAGHWLAIYSQVARKSSVLDLRQLSPKPPGQGNELSSRFRNFLDSKLVIPDGKLIHVYDPQTAEWTRININKDQATGTPSAGS